MAYGEPAPAWTGMKNGAECWGWQYHWPIGLTSPMSRIKPVRGVLAGESGRIGDTSRGPGWFVPYRKNTRIPAWTKAVRVESVNVETGYGEARENYNKAVEAAAKRFESMLAMARADLA